MIILTKISIILVIVLLFSFIVLLGHWYMKNAQNKRTDSNKRLYLNSGERFNKLHHQITHWVIEKLIFFRLDSFKNNPRGNFIFLISLLRVLGFSLLLGVFCYITNAQIDLNERTLTLFFGIYFTAVNALYFYKRRVFKEKWEYLAKLYNDLLASIPTSSAYQYCLLENTLAIDIVTTGMWGHRSFSGIAYSECKKAIDYFETHPELLELEKEIIEQKENKIITLTEIQALGLLETYQIELLKKAKEAFKQES